MEIQTKVFPARRAIIGIDASRALRAKRTGTERYALAIIRHLLALPNAAQYTWRLYLDEAAPEQLFGEYQTHSHVEARVLPRQRLWTHCALGAEVRAHPPDLLFVPAHVIPFAPARLWQRSALPPAVVTVHDLGYHHFPETHSRFQRYYLPWSTRWSCWAADAVIAVSGATAQDLQHYYALSAEKITVILEAGTEQIPSQSVAAPSWERIDAIRARYHVPPTYGLFVGTLQPRKNLPRLLAAYAQLKAADQLHWPLVVVGAPGYQADQLTTLATQLGIAGDVRFLGYLNDEETAALFQGAHLFLFPSLFEGFGLPVLEAQRYGVPVMCANNSSLPEIAGEAALLVDPTDVDAIAEAMLRLSKDEALRQQLIAAGYENVKRFSWEKAAQETLAVFEQVLRQNQRKRGRDGKSVRNDR